MSTEWQRKIEDIIAVVQTAGKILLKSGAEIFRVEDTVRRMLVDIPGVTNVNVYVVPTAITISFYLRGKPYSYTYTERQSSLNLDKIDKVNQFSRDFVANASSDYEEEKKRLKEIDESVIYTETTRIIVGGFACQAYVYLLRGTVIEGFIALIAGLFSVFITFFMQKHYLNFFLVNFIGAFLTSILLSVIHLFYKDFNIGLCLVAALLPLVPGISLTNSIRDSMAGDFTTGSSKLLEVILASIALASGGFTAFQIMNMGV